MMRLIRIAFIVCAIASAPVLPIAVSAQDSTVVKQVYTEQFQQRYNFISTEIITNSTLPTEDYGSVEISFQKTGGGYHAAQDAPTQRDFSFQTMGSKKVKQYRISGSFSYKHTLQDSVGNSLRFGWDNPQPYYLFAYKKGNWQVGQYRLKGAASRMFANEKLSAGLEINYNGLNGWRSNDPRPEQFSFEMENMAALVYHFKKQHHFGLSLGYLRSNTEVTVEYRNKDYQLSLAYPEYVTRIQYGYGFEDRSPSPNLKTSGNGYRWMALYSGNFSIGDLTLQGGYSRKNSSVMGAATAGMPDGRYGKFSDDSWNAGLFWQYSGASGKFTVEGAYKNQVLRDINSLLQTNNFVYSMESIKLKPIFARVKNNRVQYELGLDIGMSDLFRADGNTGIVSDYQNLQIGGMVAGYLHMKKNNLLKIKAGFDIQNSLDPLFRRPVQESVFIQSVIYYDYHFHTASVSSGHFDISFHKPIKNLSSFFHIGGTYQKAEIPGTDIPASLLPGTERWRWQAGIGVTL